MVSELNVLLQEINVGKTRRDALRDMAAKYEIPEMASFSRTLIQADNNGNFGFRSSESFVRRYAACPFSAVENSWP
jgi:hypothetical protein